MAPNATYLQRGEALDYRNTTESTIPHGTIVTFGTRIGVTGCDIPPDHLGTIYVCGVFRIKKTDTNAISMGQTVYFDGTGITGQEPAASEGAGSGDVSTQTDSSKDTPTVDTVIEIGYAAADADAKDDTVLVKING